MFQDTRKDSTAAPSVATPNKNITQLESNTSLLATQGKSQKNKKEQAGEVKKRQDITRFMLRKNSNTLLLGAGSDDGVAAGSSIATAAPSMGEVMHYGVQGQMKGINAQM